MAVRLPLRRGKNELEAARELTASPLVRTAEPNIIFKIGITEPDDPLYAQQWNLKGAYGVRADEAWDLQTGSAGLTLAVIDTGMDDTHPDLQGRRIDGWDYYNGDPDPRDDNGHGTVVAGIVAAETDNGIGMAGMAWGSNILVYKILDSTNKYTTNLSADAIRSAVDRGAKIINMS